ncbi:MAG: cob(I)yrinic acid a,c-diamide adenosyltransferase [Euryarchaeota archaeon]|nr:cob(I)yrinic acid a,c-diamide adenosyltransferase [Euryarchaeota archaeon]
MGYIHVYTGNGKGKTTAAFGLAMRAAGRGKKVCIVQFMKPDNGYGEQISARKLGIEVYSFGTNKFVNKKNPRKEDIELAEAGLKLSREKMASGDYDLLVLDEINVALNYKLLDVNDILDMLKSRPQRTEIVLTGRYVPDEIVQIADLVTEMREVKHYFRKGILAREGIEF